MQVGVVVYTVLPCVFGEYYYLCSASVARDQWFLFRYHTWIGTEKYLRGKQLDKFEGT